MTIRLLDLQLLYGVAGAREQFEHLCAALLRAEYPGAKEVRPQSGDGGVDIYIGDWDEPEGISVFQVKYLTPSRVMCKGQPFQEGYLR